MVVLSYLPVLNGHHSIQQPVQWGYSVRGCKNTCEARSAGPLRKKAVPITEWGRGPRDTGCLSALLSCPLSKWGLVFTQCSTGLCSSLLPSVPPKERCTKVWHQLLLISISSRWMLKEILHWGEVPGYQASSPSLKLSTGAAREDPGVWVLADEGGPGPHTHTRHTEQSFAGGLY